MNRVDYPACNKKVLFAILISLMGSYAHSLAQGDSLRIAEPRKVYAFPPDEAFLDSLDVIYGQNKVIPTSIRPQVLIALSYYPELAAARIIFEIDQYSVAHTSRPKISSLARSRPQRSYMILVSNEVKESLSGTLHTNLDFNSQIGVIGHELAHTAYYIHRNALGIIWDGIRYGSEKFKVEFERDTDKRAIAHNLGYQLYQWSSTVHDTLEANGRGAHYLSPEEILQEMQSNPAY